MNKLILLPLLILALQTSAQEFLGDKIFRANKDKPEFKFKNGYDIVELGSIIREGEKHGVIYQQIDETDYLNQLKLLTFIDNQVHEQVIDTMEMGVLANFVFVDKNFDGYNDLVITMVGNRASDFLYLYDAQANILRSIPELINYPQTKRVGESNYLYSYMATGCADSYWKSHLLRIEDFKIVQYGEIVGNGCEDEEEENGIIINAFDEPEIEMKYDTLGNFGNDKWKFIQQYWEGNVAGIMK